MEYCPAGAVKLGQKLCTKDGPITYPKQELPDAVKDVVAAVNASKEKIAQLEAAKRKEETQDEEPQEESGNAKTCSVCGTVSDSNFCPHCGAPMGK